ncbi:WYL domain-containing protein [Guyparkeria hydrothermalis]|uniref:helix-turn-helix transcriptional regulator n=1 Tax=Guyparkeria hydrothermalis TaxID=923 RepID=UPI002021E894|nr:WYL domain-containing protein [Guyparkeria hydrothermalis]MCL7744398.1 WYL domain-containing protein [Guyparkeria hydrothermalis]
MEPSVDTLKWDLRQRLKLLECTLLLNGWVRTQALTESFGISRAQASKDFAVYQSLAPENLIYDRSQKRYEASSAFAPVLLSGRTSEMLDVLAALPGEDSPVLALAALGPSVEILRPMERELDLAVFRSVSAAASNGHRVEVDYQSMRRPEPRRVVLSPHTLVYSGFRWHVRAYSHAHDEYRDFVLARIKRAESLPELAGESRDGDRDWFEEVDLAVGVHPDLPATQQAVIAADYGMSDGRVVYPVRRAMVPYFLRLMQIEPEREHPDPSIQQIRLLNPEVVEDARWD